MIMYSQNLKILKQNVVVNERKGYRETDTLVYSEDILDTIDEG